MRDEVARAEVRAKISEIELSARRRRTKSARRARGATEQQAKSVERRVGEELASEGLEDGESIEGPWSAAKGVESE